MIQLSDYQLDAVDRMTNGCILCGDVGSGKSRTALFYYFVQNGGELGVNNEYIPMSDPPKDLYIITTARKRDTLEWEGELSPFLLSTHSDANLYKNKVVVDSWNNIKKYADIANSFFIFDEQRVVGSGAWVKAFLKITRKNEWILLSATPGDTWMDYIPVFVANGFYKNRSEFIREHVIYKPFSKFPSVDRYVNVGRLIRLRRKILVDTNFRRQTIAHKKDILVDYDIQLYHRIVKERWDPWKKTPIQNAGEYCYVLRKVVNSDMSRTIAVMEIFEKHPKLIVFYNFDYELDILKGLCWTNPIGDSKVEVAEWNGHKHQPIPESECWIYLVQYTAGAEGWNCIKTDTIVFYSQNYSYKTVVQARGRIDRMNTPFKDLYYYHLKSRAPIDSAISIALKSKRKFNETAFAGDTFGRT